MSDTYETKKKLIKFKKRFGLRDDWHELDEQGIQAKVVGNHLDNAFGDAIDHGEFVVVLYKDGESPFKNELTINLATLLALASKE